MKISVVLNVLNERRHMRDLLDSLVIQEKPWEIVVVDAGSNDGTVEIVQNYMKKHPEIRFFHCPGTRGESTNFGIQQASGDAVATTGGDCIANPFWIKELRRSLLQFDIVAGRTINIGFHAWEDLERVELYHRGFDISFPSASMAWRKEVLDDVGGFDPWFVTAEDIDINLRAVDRGYTMTYNQDAIVYHRTKGSYKGFFKQAFWNGWGRKQLTVKHGRLWSNYKPQRLIETSRSMWAMARLAVALLGYVSCKLFEKIPEELIGDRGEPVKRKRKPFKFVYPGR
ncbi:MAG: glycosyltransferase [Thermoplasmata archaeon]|jgi:glycosyltransferase involved in cell wall biosynthesis|nr:glycosyltransferase [Thermoplasmata archaeon]